MNSGLVTTQRFAFRSAIVAWVAAVAVHLLLLWIPWSQWWPLATPPSRFEVGVNEVDPAKLAALKKKWEQQARTPLLQPQGPTAQEPPPDARFEADRNIRVEKQQRAQSNQVVPRVGSPPQSTTDAPSPAQESPTSPRLDRLGLKIAPPKAPAKNLKGANSPVTQNSGSPASGGPQSILDDSLPVGAENLLNAQESVYYSYYSRIYSTIGPLWQSRIHQVQRRVSPGSYTTTVEVVFDYQGNLQTIYYQSSSGISEFDAAVEESWKRIRHFPNPPVGLVGEDGLVRTGWTFTVRVDQDFTLINSAPRRIY